MGKHLPNAPIAEALLDIRVELPADSTIEQLARVHDRIRDDYPVRRERVDFSAKFDPQARSVAMEAVRNTGYFFWSADEHQAAQVRLDGFALSRLKPYDRWESLRDEARRLWKVYVELAKPRRITRVALRYINRLELPPQFQFSDYLRTYPTLSESCPQTISGLFMRVVTGRGKDHVVISEAIEEQQAQSETVGVILDIDAFRPMDLAVTLDEEAWSALEELRILKNDIFFGSITERAEEMFR